MPSDKSVAKWPVLRTVYKRSWKVNEVECDADGDGSIKVSRRVERKAPPKINS